MTIRSLVLALCGAAWVGFAGTPHVLAQKSAEEELATLQVPEGFEVSLFAAEPLITNPAAIDIDTHGRVWVAEIQWYRRAAKNPPADQIKVLEDTDGDGKADKVTVFAEGIFAPMSICVAGTKVYVATSPDLWVFEDKNGDLKADGPPEKLLTGFGGHNHDHGAHSLVLGPDHKWWMSHGDTGFNVTGKDGSKIEFKWGAMLRGELDGTKLEAISVNYRNPYEIAVSSFGESFCSDNDNDGNRSVRICWTLEGGNYGWFGGPPFGINDVANRLAPNTPFAEHWHFRGYIPGYVPGTLVTGFGSPCGMCFYEGDAFGPKYKNAPWHADAGPREVRIYRHETSGYGMKATSENVVTTSGDNYFRPDDVCTAPDGSLYIADWYDGGVGGHAYNDPDRGRLFRLTPKGKKLVRREKPGPYASIEDAIIGLQSPNLATQFLAREKLLAEGEKSVSALSGLLTAADPNFHARALWVLDRIGGAGRQVVAKELASQNDSFRALAVRILRRHGESFAAPILALASDKAPEVRREVLLAIAKLDTPAAMDALVKLTEQYSGNDRYELETINIAAGARRDQLYEKLAASNKWTAEKLSLLQVIKPEAAAALVLAALSNENLDPQAGDKLLATVAAMPQPDAGKALLKLVDRKNAPIELRRAALERVSGNLAGAWKDLAGDPAWQASLEGALADAKLRTAALGVIRERGLSKFGPQVAAIAKDPNTDAASRQEAIGLIASLKIQGASQTLRELLAEKDAATRKAALNALIDLQDNRTLREVLSGTKYAANVQSEVAERIMGTTGGALVLLRLIDEKSVSEAIQKQAIALALKHPDSNVQTLFEKFVPEADRPKRLGSAIKPQEILALAGDAKRGEQIFFQSSAAQCKNCHVVQGIGNSFGPDLSQIGKKYGREALLETILDPSKAISHEYVPHVVETVDGQVYVGFVIEKSEQQVVLKDIKSQVIRVPQKDVALIEEQKKSLMPELVLKDVTAQDAADMLAYLADLKEGVQTVTRFRIAGPFPAGGGGLDKKLPPEENLKQPNFAAKFKVVGGKQLGWEYIEADNSVGFAAFDSVKYDESQKVNSSGVIHYFATIIDSPTEQEAGFLVGSDDGVIVYVNGAQVHRHAASRALGYGQDRFRVKLSAGRNVVILKVENGAGPGGAALSISAATPVKFVTE